MKKISIFITLFVIVTAGNAQFSPTKLGTNLGTVSNNNAVLEIAGNNSILLPRVNLTNTTSFSPLSQFTDGMMVYNKQAINDVVAGPYICFNSKWNRLINVTRLTPSLPSGNLGLTTTSAPFYTVANYHIYNASSGLTLNNDAAANSCFKFNVDAVVSNDGSGNYPPTPNNFFGKFAFNTYQLNDFNYVQPYFDPFNLGWHVYQYGNVFDMGYDDNYQIKFNATNSIASTVFVNYRNPSYNQTLTTDKIFIKNGVIQTGGLVGITNSANLGLYSCRSSYWIRLGTNQAPIKFYSDLDTNGGIGNDSNMTIESNGNVGIGTNFTPSNKLDVQGTIRSVSGGLFSELDTVTGPFLNLNNSLKTPFDVKQNWRIRNEANIAGFSSRDGLFFSSYDGSNQNANNNMILADNGNVGIGINKPNYKLDVMGTIIVQNTGSTDFITKNGNVNLISNSKTQSNAAKYWFFSNYDFNNGLTFNAVSSTLSPIVTNALTIDNSGKIVIGNSYLNSYNAKLTVIGSQNNTVSNYAFLKGSTSELTGYRSGQAYNSYSIWADWRIASDEFNAFSDARIKNIKGKSNSKNDLQILKQIEITDYTKKDSISDASSYKKVIAQQVEKVYPQAVHQSKGFIPNVYKSAQATDGQINLITDFKPGDRIKLIIGTGDIEVKVTQVTNDFFKVDKPITEKVFVFGKEVDDFRNVDYEAIAMLNVSATQEIANRLEKLDHQLTELDTKNKVLLNRKDDLVKKIKGLLTK
ncbi:tail fiber domain-containing protein [Flavobacterium aciduliphilum]|uniref:Endosialidase-like protein n=1 Tax=Flavobacterium aciduliphilum TaxID=1101402 RepID=A0A328YML1_9FLAO|nr:tail fiber domain-containing protein [Flavobacterium aciduliphilum]RAR75311.1 endosialidase-like protein [Flavobacterium aciduliphilum]